MDICITAVEKYPNDMEKCTQVMFFRLAHSMHAAEPAGCGLGCVLVHTVLPAA